MECVRSRNEKGLTVYVDRRPILQIRGRSIIAFQYNYSRERMLINTILEEEGLSSKYFLSPEGLIEYKEGGIKVWTLKDLVLTSKQ